MLTYNMVLAAAAQAGDVPAARKWLLGLVIHLWIHSSGYVSISMCKYVIMHGCCHGSGSGFHPTVRCKTRSTRSFCGLFNRPYRYRPKTPYRASPKPETLYSSLIESLEDLLHPPEPSKSWTTWILRRGKGTGRAREKSRQRERLSFCMKLGSPFRLQSSMTPVLKGPLFTRTTHRYTAV